MGTNDGGLTRYPDGVFTSYTVADGVPEGAVLFFTRDLKGELLIGIAGGQFYMRQGKFISAPPEYLVPLLKNNYLALSGSQWTITTINTLGHDELVANLTSSVTCIRITASHVYLMLNGHTITGSYGASASAPASR